MDLPLVTIAAINYNSSKYVVETLNSIKDQTYSNIELVIIDDCSTDNSVELIKDWLKSYNKPYKFVQHEKNKGVCAACNSAVNNATGKYLTLIATDDLILPEKCKIQVDILEKTGDDTCAVYSDAYLIKEDGSPRYGWLIQKFRDFEELPSGNIYDTLLKGNYLFDTTFLVKRSCYLEVGPFDESLAFEDYDMFLRLARKYKFVVSDYVSTKYRLRNNSLSSTYDKWSASKLKIYAKQLEYSDIAKKQMETITIDAYFKGDGETMDTLPKYKGVSKKIDTISLLWRLKAPALLTKVVLRLFF